MSNIRPISLTHIVGKVLEKVVNKNLVLYLEDRPLLSHKQYGFRKGCSTTDCIMELLHHISFALYTTCVFLDYKKVFDSVEHTMLLDKLRCYRISQLGLDWFESYCKDQIQQVKCDGKFSRKLPIGNGVPQVSILGPALFTLCK